MPLAVTIVPMEAIFFPFHVNSTFFQLCRMFICFPYKPLMCINFLTLQLLEERVERKKRNNIEATFYFISFVK